MNQQQNLDYIHLDDSTQRLVDNNQDLSEINFAYHPIDLENIKPDIEPQLASRGGPPDISEDIIVRRNTQNSLNDEQAVGPPGGELNLDRAEEVVNDGPGIINEQIVSEQLAIEVVQNQPVAGNGEAIIQEPQRPRASQENERLIPENNNEEAPNGNRQASDNLIEGENLPANEMLVHPVGSFEDGLHSDEDYSEIFEKAKGTLVFFSMMHLIILEITVCLYLNLNGFISYHIVFYAFWILELFLALYSLQSILTESDITEKLRMKMYFYEVMLLFSTQVTWYIFIIRGLKYFSLSLSIYAIYVVLMLCNRKLISKTPTIRYTVIVLRLYTVIQLFHVCFWADNILKWGWKSLLWSTWLACSITLFYSVGLFIIFLCTLVFCLTKEIESFQGIGIFWFTALVGGFGFCVFYIGIGLVDFFDNRIVTLEVYNSKYTLMNLNTTMFTVMSIQAFMLLIVLVFRNYLKKFLARLYGGGNVEFPEGENGRNHGGQRQGHHHHHHHNNHHHGHQHNGNQHRNQPEVPEIRLEVQENIMPYFLKKFSPTYYRRVIQNPARSSRRLSASSQFQRIEIISGEGPPLIQASDPAPNNYNNRLPNDSPPQVLGVIPEVQEGNISEGLMVVKRHEREKQQGEAHHSNDTQNSQNYIITFGVRSEGEEQIIVQDNKQTTRENEVLNENDVLIWNDLKKENARERGNTLAALTNKMEYDVTFMEHKLPRPRMVSVKKDQDIKDFIQTHRCEMVLHIMGPLIQKNKPFSNYFSEVCDMVDEKENKFDELNMELILPAEGPSIYKRWEQFQTELLRRKIIPNRKIETHERVARILMQNLFGESIINQAPEKTTEDVIKHEEKLNLIKNLGDFIYEELPGSLKTKLRSYIEHLVAEYKEQVENNFGHNLDFSELIYKKKSIQSARLFIAPYLLLLNNLPTEEEKPTIQFQEEASEVPFYKTNENHHLLILETLKISLMNLISDKREEKNEEERLMNKEKKKIFSDSYSTPIKSRFDSNSPEGNLKEYNEFLSKYDTSLFKKEFILSEEPEFEALSDYLSDGNEDADLPEHVLEDEEGGNLNKKITMSPEMKIKQVEDEILELSFGEDLFKKESPRKSEEVVEENNKAEANIESGADFLKEFLRRKREIREQKLLKEQLELTNQKDEVSLAELMAKKGAIRAENEREKQEDEDNIQMEKEAENNSPQEPMNNLLQQNESEQPLENNDLFIKGEEEEEKKNEGEEEKKHEGEDDKNNEGGDLRKRGGLEGDEEEEEEKKVDEMVIDKDDKKESAGQQEKKSQTKEQFACLICFSNTADCVLMNCGHGGICYECATAVCKTKPECHLCRQVVAEILRFDPEFVSENDEIKIIAITRIKKRKRRRQHRH